jgi:hypothetical protein
MKSHEARKREAWRMIVWEIVAIPILLIAYVIIETRPTAMTSSTLASALNTIAQCAAALAALIGLLGLWRLDRLQEHQAEAAHYLHWVMRGEHLNMDQQNAHEVMIPSTDLLIAGATARLAANAREESDARFREFLGKLRYTIDIEAFQRWRALPDEQRQLMRVLCIFLMGTLLILAASIISFAHVDCLATWAWTPRLLYVASTWLAGAPLWVVWQAGRSIS